MRIIEIILKLAFLIVSICLIVNKTVAGSLFTVFLIISILLGIILIVNKDSSYRYPHVALTYLIRRIEGVVLILFAIMMFMVMR